MHEKLQVPSPFPYLVTATSVDGLYCIIVLTKVLGDSTFVVKASFEIDVAIRPIL